VLRVNAPDDDRGYRVLWIEAAYLKPDAENPIGFGTYDRLQGFAMRAQLNRLEEGAQFYGWDVCFREPYLVTPRDAKRMVKVFREIDRKYQATVKRLGPPSDYASFAAYVAAALGITQMVWKQAGEWRRRPIADGVGYIRWLERDARPKSQAA